MVRRPPRSTRTDTLVPYTTLFRSPNNGRLLKKDDFSLEITVFESGVPPQFRVIAYVDGKPIDPSTVQLSMELTRLDGEVNPFTFVVKDGVLVGDGTVEEPDRKSTRLNSSH